MASLALGFVGTVAGGLLGGPLGAQLGGALGAALGGLIDNQLFPQKQEGPRLQDLAVQVSTYGQMIPLLFGPENRVAGNVIYSSGLIEKANKQKSGGKGGPSVSVTNYTYSTNIAVALCDAQRKPISRVVKIWANSKLVYSAPGASGSLAPDPISAKVWAQMNFHDGAFTQLPDSLIEGALGIGNVPAYRGTSYVVIWGLQLADYGNRLPNLEFLVEADGEINVDGVLTYIVTLCGIDPNTVSSTSIQDPVRGYQIGTASSGSGAIQPLALAYDFDSVSVAGALRFVPRGRGIAGRIPNALLAGHQGGDTRPELIHWTRDAETNLPQQASISFADPDRDYQINAQTARRVAGSAQNNLSNQVPLVMDVATAGHLVDRMLWEVWNSRDTATFSGDDRLIDVRPGGVYIFNTPAGLEPMRIKTKQRGANGVINFEVLRDRAEVYQSTFAGVPSPAAAQEVDVPGPAEIFLIDTPLLADADDDTGFYFVIDGLSGGTFRGATVERSIDGGVSYGNVAPAGRSSCLGTINALADGITEFYDLANVIRVTLDDPTDQLESVTELALLQGENACWIGAATGEDGEILQFMTATMVSAGVYDLSILLRGRLGTEFATAGHVAGNRFVLLDANAIYRADYGPADWNKARSYKAVSLLTLEADATAVNFTNTGEGKRPLSPVQIKGVKDPVSGDSVVTWTRRSRLREPGLGNGMVPLGEAVESYEIDVIFAAVVKRTLTSSTPTVTYTAAMRTADTGGSSAVTINVYQISDVRGRGRPGTAGI